MLTVVRMLLVTVFALALYAPAFAMEGCGTDCASCHSLTKEEAGGLLKGVGTVKGVRPSQVRGLFEVTVEKDGKTGLVFVDYSKKLLISGQVYDISTLNPLGPAKDGPRHSDRLDPSLLEKDHALVMGNPNGKKQLFVFTDPECPFCAKLHGELKKLVEIEPDLAIYIKLYPLKMHPHAYEKAQVILARGSLELLEKSFAGGKLPAPKGSEGKKAVDETMKFAEKVGINSTPTMVLPDGRMLIGVREAAQIKSLLSP